MPGIVLAAHDAAHHQASKDNRNGDKVHLPTNDLTCLFKFLGLFSIHVWVHKQSSDFQEFKLISEFRLLTHFRFPTVLISDNVVSD